MHTKYFILLCTIAVAVFHQRCLGQLAPKEARIIAGFGKDLGDYIKDDNVHGSISAAVVQNGRVIWASAFGQAGVDSDTPADTGTIYRIASITKTFTAVLLMLLVEEGKVGLDDPVEKYVPEVAQIQGYGGGTKFTLRQLASHTSGLKREPDMPGASLGPVSQWQSKLLACIPHTSFNSGPGEQFLYSNIGYALLGLALERAAGVPYIQMVQEKIFTPLHMDNTFFSIPDEKFSKLAQGIDNKKEDGINTKLPLQQMAGMGYRVPNGGIWSTPLDVAKFVIALMGGYPLLKPASTRQMLTVPPGGKNYGLGMMMLHNRLPQMIGHNGSDPGYTSQFAIGLPDGNNAVILMRNYNVGKSDLEEVASDILGRLR